MKVRVLPLKPVDKDNQVHVYDDVSDAVITDNSTLLVLKFEDGGRVAYVLNNILGWEVSDV